MSPRRMLLSALLVLAGAYAALCLLLFFFQSRLVWFPFAELATTPAQQGLAHHELRIEAADGVALHGWLLEAQEPRGVVLVSHGNAGNVSHRLPLARAFLAMELSVLLFDYRGYGESAGKPSEEGTYLDAVAFHEHLVGELGIAPERIVLYGESLGGAVALELALRRPVAGVVVENLFTSVPAMGAELYPWLPVRWLARIRYDAAAKVRRLRVPLLVVHSREDDIVPFEHARKLRALAGEGSELLVTDGGHNDGGFLRRPEWIAAVERFVLRCLEGTG